MNIIKVTPLTKKRTKQILNDLFPEFEYQRIKNSGIVVLKRKWWSLKKTIIPITDLYIDSIPKRLADNCKRKGYGGAYEAIISNDIYVMLQLKIYKKEMNLVDYIWEKYNRLYREVPIINIQAEVNLLTEPSQRYLPVLSPVSTYFIPGVEKLIKQMKKKDSVESLIEKISKIQVKTPQFLVRSLELKFA